MSSHITNLAQTNARNKAYIYIFFFYLVLSLSLFSVLFILCVNTLHYLNICYTYTLYLSTNYQQLEMGMVLANLSLCSFPLHLIVLQYDGEIK